MDQLVAGAGPGFAGACVTKVVAHAGRARRKDRQTGAALALKPELAALDRLADLVVRHARAGRRRLAGLVRLDLLGAPSLVRRRRGRVVAVAINDHRDLPHLSLRQLLSARRTAIAMLLSAASRAHQMPGEAAGERRGPACRRSRPIGGVSTS